MKKNTSYHTNKANYFFLKKIFAIIIFAFGWHCVFAQNSPNTDSIAAQIEKLRNEKAKLDTTIKRLQDNLQKMDTSAAKAMTPKLFAIQPVESKLQLFREKVYVKTDKATYIAGETIWFKIYNVDGYYNKPLSFEKVAYVEVLGSNQKPVMQAKIELDNGTGKGFLLIPFSLNSGAYILRAYTSWMKNFPNSIYYEQRLNVINTFKKPDWSNLEQPVKYDIQFFPEGGDLVNDLESTIGFKITDQYGKGLEGNGILINSNGDTITDFHTQKFGMGNFSFTPAENKYYKAAVRINGETIIKDLPVVKASGYVLHLASLDSNHLSIEVQSTNTQTTEPVYLSVQTKHLLKSTFKKSTNNGFTNFIIDVDSLGEGISQFTLYNANHQAVCERLYFKQPQHKLNIGISTNQPIYKRRAPGTVDITFSHKADEQHNVSISIVNFDSLQTLPETDIQSYLWLSSDIGGYIESAAYYFLASSPELKAAADNLMLTQGWRKFTADSAYFYTARQLKFMPETEGPLVTGTTISKTDGQVISNIQTYVSSPGEVFQLRNAVSDSKGTIRFAFKNNPGNDQLIFQPATGQVNNASISLDNPFAEDSVSSPFSPFRLSPSWQKQLETHSLNVQSQNIYLKEFNYLLSPERLDSFQFYGKADRTYYLDDYTRFITMDEVMREIVAEAKVRKQGNNFLFEVKNNATNTFFTDNPLMLIDGVPVFNPDKVIAIDPLKVSKIDVVARKYFIGGNDYNGVISYSTYKHDLAGYELPADATVLRFEGPQLKREFYSPQYPATPKASHIPDFRTVLFWKPDHISINSTDAIPFNTSDVPGNYMITVEGITSEGLCGSSSYFFKVE